ncbi:MAG: hypothetical protein AAF997_23130 [Myxococcota bacterium]
MSYAAPVPDLHAEPLRSLSWVLRFKVGFTLAVWAIPMLLLPASMLEAVVGFVPEPMLWVRLLGWAYLALCVGYLDGLRIAQRGMFPRGVVLMGIVSNGGAAVLLLLSRLFGVASELQGLPAIGVWLSIVVLLAITASLMVAWVRAR